DCTINFSSCEAAGWCGDVIIQGVEECDGENLGGETCGSIDDRLSGTDLRCNDQCQFDTSHCIGGGICGNDIINAGEDCEGENLDGATCLTEGYHGGVLACNGSCGFDYSGCESFGKCGDGVVQEAYEQCDGAQVPSTCDDLDYYGGNLLCNTDCTFNTSSCEAAGWCGDSSLQAPEETCDGTDVGGTTCEDLNYYGGTLACEPDCSGFNTADCAAAGTCGDDVLQATHEQCDGSEVGDVTCRELTRGLNMPGCKSDCTLDASACSNVLQWGTAADDVIKGLALASDGGIIYAGSTTGVLPSSTNHGGTDAVLGKLAPSGEVLWQHQYGSAGFDEFAAVKVDSAGDIIATGAFSGTLAGGTPDSTIACVVAKFDGATVDVIWASMLGDSGDVRCSRLALSADDTIFVAGVVNSGAFYMAGILGNDNSDVFVARLLPDDGAISGATGLATTDEDTVGGLALRTNGEVYLAVNSSGDVAGETNQGGIDGFIVRYNDLNLTYGYTFNVGSAGEDYINDITVDASDLMLLVAGGTNGDLGGGILMGGVDAFLGVYVFGDPFIGFYSRLGGDLDEVLNCIAPGEDGFLIAGGSMESANHGGLGTGVAGGYMITRLPLTSTGRQEVTINGTTDVNIVALVRDAWGNVIAAAQCDSAFPGTDYAGGDDFCLLHWHPN
ncbi:hypothetical protein KJ865_13445, partial [Myxococcota bacterium]|nr:hypothetical protein [Myxococcota bacterium]